jgi:hypothetical protein
MIYEGVEPYCRGIVFDLEDVRGEGFGSIKMVCISLEYIHGDFHSLVFQRYDLAKGESCYDRIWNYDGYVYSGFGANVEVMKDEVLEGFSNWRERFS